MRNAIILSLLTLVVSAASAQNTKAAIESLGWLAGCWEMNLNGRLVSEQWMKPAGMMMMGMSRSVKEGRTYEYEFIRLMEESDGSIQYVARPSGQEGASFKLVLVEERKAVFENLEHDFPQRIIYRLLAADSLLARVEGTKGGTVRGIDFPYRRVSCD